MEKMATEGGRIDFMFLTPLPGRWLRYCISVLFLLFSVNLTQSVTSRLHSAKIAVSQYIFLNILAGKWRFNFLITHH